MTARAHYWISTPRSREPDRWDVSVEVRPGEEAHELDIGRLTILSVTRDTAVAELEEFRRLGYELVSELRVTLELLAS